MECNQYRHATNWEGVPFHHHRVTTNRNERRERSTNFIEMKTIIRDSMSKFMPTRQLR